MTPDLYDKILTYLNAGEQDKAQKILDEEIRKFKSRGRKIFFPESVYSAGKGVPRFIESKECVEGMKIRGNVGGK